MPPSLRSKVGKCGNAAKASRCAIASESSCPDKLKRPFRFALEDAQSDPPAQFPRDPSASPSHPQGSLQATQHHIKERALRGYHNPPVSCKRQRAWSRTASSATTRDLGRRSPDSLEATVAIGVASSVLLTRLSISYKKLFYFWFTSDRCFCVKVKICIDNHREKTQTIGVSLA